MKQFKTVEHHCVGVTPMVIHGVIYMENRERINIPSVSCDCDCDCAWLCDSHVDRHDVVVKSWMVVTNKERGVAIYSNAPPPPLASRPSIFSHIDAFFWNGVSKNGGCQWLWFCVAADDLSGKISLYLHRPLGPICFSQVPCRSLAAPLPFPCRLTIVTFVRIENWDDMERFLQQALVIEWNYNQQDWDMV